jgi:hypothetical protein
VSGALPIILGGSGLVGLGGLFATFFLLRSQRDVNIADAAGRLVQASSTFTGSLDRRLGELTEEVRALRVELAIVRRERDAARRERDEALAQLGGRRAHDC